MKTKIVTDITEISSDPNYYVEIKCNKCGKVYCLFPNRVLFPPKCDCGNTESGNFRDWKLSLFGNFTLVKASIQHLYIKTPYGKMGF